MQMPLRARHILTIAVLALPGLSLGGCGTINEKMSAGVGDYIPQWAGGLPADAPPRPGTPQYDAYMQERERQRLMPADQRNPKPTKPDQSGLDPVH